MKMLILIAIAFIDSTVSFAQEPETIKMKEDTRNGKAIYYVLKSDPNTYHGRNSCKLLNEDPIVIKEFLTRAQYFYGAQKFQMIVGKERSRSARDLIELIKKEYHFK